MYEPELGIYRFKMWRYAYNMHESDILDFAIKSTLCNNTMLRQITESIVFSNEAKKVQDIISRTEYNLFPRPKGCCHGVKGIAIL